MAGRTKKAKQPFNILIVAQGGRLEYEAALFAASLRARSPGFAGRLIVAEPQPGPKWNDNPSIRHAAVRELLVDLGAEIVPLENRHFGQSYPNGNKIEALACLPEGEPFVFFDSDTLILDELTKVPFDFDRPTASLRREGTWPIPELYGPGYAGIWKSLYDRFDLEFETTLDLAQPDEYWRRYLYFNAGFFFYKCPRIFGEKFLSYALEIRNNPPVELAGQALFPWLDQIALPLVIHALGGARDTLPEGLIDGDVTCHWRIMPLAWARESDQFVEVLREVAAPNRVKKVLKEFEPYKRYIYQNRGAKTRALFDRDKLPRREQAIRNQIRKAGLWMR